MVRDNLEKVEREIAVSCAKAGRQRQEITLVAITKGRSVEQIQEVISCGISDIGENRVQEALLKYNDKRLANSARLIKWHLVGHLQTNKVKEAVRIFDLIHSVDSLRLAKEIDKQAAKISKTQDILIEVKTSPEETKFGINPDELPQFVKEIAQLKHISVKGLMTIAPMVDNPEKTRIYFRRLRMLLEEVNLLSTINYRLSAISMGMSDDFAAAIEVGSTMVRIGRAVFD
ncbi:MAG: YggS family pyridoxal phosphate-dependent enzyme [Candidatus Omnitrophota bacterium]